MNKPVSFRKRFIHELPALVGTTLVFTLLTLAAWQSPGTHWFIWTGRLLPLCILIAWQVYNVVDVRLLNKRLLHDNRQESDSSNSYTQ